MFGKFYGVRGSHAVPGLNTVKYGGNTSCVTVLNDTPEGIDRIIIDAGTGVVALGKEIIGNYFAKKESLNILHLFTHLHPDHTEGFPFFAPNYFKESNMDLYGMEALGKNIGIILSKSMVPPRFPIEYADLKSKRIHHIVREGDTTQSLLGSMTIKVMQAYAPSHPQQGATYYRITDNSTGRSICCVWDLESKSGGDMAVINFCKDTDVMIHDTQYTTEEYFSPKMVVQGFGHSTYDMAVENAIKANVRQTLYCTHFNPNHSDQKLDEIQDYVTTVQGIGDTLKSHQFNILLAKEHLVFEV